MFLFAFFTWCSMFIVDVACFSGVCGVFQMVSGVLWWWYLYFSVWFFFLPSRGLARGSNPLRENCRLDSSNGRAPLVVRGKNWIHVYPCESVVFTLCCVSVVCFLSFCVFCETLFFLVYFLCCVCLNLHCF